VTRSGKLLWTNTELKYKHQHGPGGSPVVYKDLLLLNCDGIDIQYLVALNKKTGEIVWKTDRKHVSQDRIDGKKIGGMGFSTPLLWESKGVMQMISTGADHVAGYDVKTGEELWWSEYDGYSLVPRPVIGLGMVFVCSGYNTPMVYGIELGGKGNVTESHVKWELKKGAPHNPSPILVGEELYLVSDRGIGTCMDAKTGEIHWQERLGGSYSASPIYADGLIYILDEGGTTKVIKAAKELEVVAENKLLGRTLSSISIAEKALFLRTDRHLYKIEKK
jgi:outer membrane protein assembly factor BamB